MNQQGSRDPTLSPSSSTGHIDRLCDEFEKACQAGKPPLIEDFLLQIPVADRDRLLGELLEIELDVRQRAGEFVQVEDYRTRFPENPNLIESVFRRVVKTRRLGDYQLLEELGRGGMGVVYKARQIYLDQTVAVKILPRRYLDDPQAVSRFRREMQSIGGLNHPNIVRAYNAGEASGVHFLVMEFVDGINLQQLVGMTMRRAAPSLPARPARSSARRPSACNMLTSINWSTATSSRPTSCSAATATRPRSSFSIWGWPGFMPSASEIPPPAMA